MSTTTTNYGLVKPDGTDLVDIDVINGNMDTIDTTLAGKAAVNADTTGNAGTATKLATAREIYVALGSTRDTSNKVTFDGSAAKAIHVSGTLPVARGGTGATTADGALSNLGALPLSGGTLTGNLRIKHGSTIDRDGAAPSSDTFRWTEIVDKDDERIAAFSGTMRTSGITEAGIYAYNEPNGGGGEVMNSLRVMVASDGTKSFAVGDGAAFRNAIGASSGVFPASAGGTGKSTLKDASEAMVQALPTETASLTDSEYIVVRKVGTTDSWCRRSLAALWVWAKGKVQDWLAPAQYGVASLITQTSAEEANFTVTNAWLETSGYTAQLRVEFQVASALTVGTQYSIGTIGSAIRPATSAMAMSSDMRALGTVKNDGPLYIRPLIERSAGTTKFYLNSTYILASLYTG